MNETPGGTITADELEAAAADRREAIEELGRMAERRNDPALQLAVSLLDQLDALAGLLTRRMNGANGDGELRRVTLPADVRPAHYVGTWRHGESYTRGALVTHSGALWHCERDGATGRPGACNDFKLTHKTLEGGKKR